MTLRHRALPDGVNTASRDGGPRRGRLRHRGRLYMASLPAANREYRLRELKMSGRSPLQARASTRSNSRRQCLPGPSLSSPRSGRPLRLIVRISAPGDGADRRLEASHYDLMEAREVRPQTCAAHGLVPDQPLRREGRRLGARRPAASPGMGGVGGGGGSPAVGNSHGDQEEVDGETRPCRKVATVPRGALRLVYPRGSLALARRNPELAELFARADGETRGAARTMGPDAAARSALEFLRRLTESLGLVEL